MSPPRTGPRNLESTGDCYCGKVRKIGRCTRRDNRAVTSRRRGQVPKVDSIDNYGKSFKVTAIGVKVTRMKTPTYQITNSNVMTLMYVVRIHNADVTRFVTLQHP